MQFLFLGVRNKSIFLVCDFIPTPKFEKGENVADRPTPEKAHGQCLSLLLLRDYFIMLNPDIKQARR